MADITRKRERLIYKKKCPKWFSDWKKTPDILGNLPQELPGEKDMFFARGGYVVLEPKGLNETELRILMRIRKENDWIISICGGSGDFPGMGVRVKLLPRNLRFD